MSEQPDGMDAVSAALAQIDAGVDALQVALLSSVSSLGLTDSLRRLETLLLRAQSGARALVGEMDRRGVAAELFAASTADILCQLLNLDPREVCARVRQAREWTPRVAVTGELLEPLFAHVAAALDAGEISVAHARIISDTRTGLPADIDTVHGDAAEALLVEHALTLNPKDLRAVAQRLIDTLNPDGKLNDEADQERRRDFRLIDNPDGSSTPAGRFTPELTALIRPALDALSAPQPAGDIPDTRTAGQRRHDAIAEGLTLLYRSGSLPDAGGVPVSISVIITEDDITRAQTGQTVIVEDSYGTPLSLDTLAAISAEIRIGSITLTTTGGIHDYGRTRRLATCDQRRALTARDKGCAAPGCTRHASWCETHHIIGWLHGGETNLTNMVLLCRYHHRHFQQAGWSVHINNNGIPEWTPPPWLDPDQKPRHNTAHNKPRIPTLN